MKDIICDREFPGVKTTCPIRALKSPYKTTKCDNVARIFVIHMHNSSPKLEATCYVHELTYSLGNIIYTITITEEKYRKLLALV